jgi:hypothetical protein
MTMTYEKYVLEFLAKIYGLAVAVSHLIQTRYEKSSKKP